MSELTTGQFSVVHWADKKLDIVAHEISAEGVSHSFVIAKMSVECALALASKLIAESGYTLVKQCPHLNSALSPYFEQTCPEEFGQMCFREYPNG